MRGVLSWFRKWKALSSRRQPSALFRFSITIVMTPTTVIIITFIWKVEHEKFKVNNLLFFYELWTKRLSIAAQYVWTFSSLAIHWIIFSLIITGCKVDPFSFESAKSFSIDQTKSGDPTFCILTILTTITHTPTHPHTHTSKSTFPITLTMALHAFTTAASVQSQWLSSFYI